VESTLTYVNLINLESYNKNIDIRNREGNNKKETYDTWIRESSNTTTKTNEDREMAVNKLHTHTKK
jgi:hypothetical protein